MMEHITQATILCKSVRQAELKLNIKEFRFAVAEDEVIDHVVSVQVIKTYCKKTKRIENERLMEYNEEILSFFTFFLFCCHLVACIEKGAAPLHPLTAEKELYWWNIEANESFGEI